MTHYTIHDDQSVLKGKVVLVTGGASGIGEGIVQVATSIGAYVVFGDLNKQLGQSVADTTGAIFVEGDVCSYHDILNMFKQTIAKYGRIDYAISNAAIYETYGFFDLALTIEDLEKEPATKILDVNMKSVIMFARIASVYLRQDARSGEDRALVFISSTAALLLPENTPLYNTSKSAILALTRSLAQALPQHHNIRVNAICPSVTRTPLAQIHALPAWEAAELPVNSSQDVGRAVLQTCCNVSDNRKILYVEGGKAWDIEQALLSLVPQWVGEGPLETLRKIGRA